MPSEALALTASTYLVLGSLGHLRSWSGALSELRRASTCGTEGLLDAGLEDSWWHDAGVY